MKNEANRISQKTSRNVEEFTEEIEGFRPYIYTMKKTKEGKCVFLKEDLCTIYPMRPLICRFYPFEFKSDRNNRYIFTCTDECPGVGEGPKIDGKFFDALFRRLKKQVETNSA
jgi:Fe-S-cluster containining protein